jgi:hypothetical protein
VEGLKVPPHPGKDVRCEDSAEPHAEMDIAAERRPIKALPEPDKGLDLGIPRRIHIRVVFRLQRDVSRIQREQRDPGGLRGFRILEHAVVVASPGIVDLEKQLSGNPVPVGSRCGELPLQVPQPAVVKLFGRFGEAYLAKRQQDHGALMDAVVGTLKRWPWTE